MKTCLLNLPYYTRIVRRYSCTYYAPNFLYPPLELMYLGGIIKEWKKDDCILIDAIAEGLSLNKIVTRLKKYQPDLLVFMAGIESFTEDMQAIMTIKSHLPALKITCMGYLPTVFPKETLENNPAIDYAIMNEPELSFSELYDEIKKDNLSQEPIKGIAKRRNGNIFVAEQRDGIGNLDAIPFPARSLVNISLYSEFLLQRPFATMLTSRGCPFECAFCIPTYWKKVSYRSVENVAQEIEEAVSKYKIRTIRFLDDTFTLQRERIIKLCEQILKRNLNFKWAILARIGMLDERMVSLMHRAGLKRIYLGIETGSQRLLDYYRKGYNANLITEQVKIIKKNNIEITGFFIVGGLQTEEELREDIVLAKNSKLDFITAAPITVYPGTKLFEKTKHELSFNLFPYFNAFKDGELQKRGIRLTKMFYRDFYLNFRCFRKKFKFLFLDPKTIIIGVKRLVVYIFFAQDNRRKRPNLI